MGSGWGTHVNPWLIHVNVWQRPLQYCKVISLQLIKINGGKKTNIMSLELISPKNSIIQPLGYLKFGPPNTVTCGVLGVQRGILLSGSVEIQTRMSGTRNREKQDSLKKSSRDHTFEN